MIAADSKVKQDILILANEAQNTVVHTWAGNVGTSEFGDSINPATLYKMIVTALIDGHHVQWLLQESHNCILRIVMKQ